MQKYESQDIVSNYVKYRPKLVYEIGLIITSYMKKSNLKKENNKWDTLVDVGCGSGQATDLLAPYFNNVYGFDISKNQIKMAKLVHQNKGYNFNVARAEDLPIESKSVDLVSCSVAAHWLDYDKFVKETWRVLKPNGVVAIFTYFTTNSETYLRNAEIKSKTMIEDALELVHIFHSKCINHPRTIHNIFNQKYDDIFDNLPGKDKKSDTSVILTNNWTLEELNGFYKSYDGYEAYVVKKTKELALIGQEFTIEHDIVEEFMQGLKNIWGIPNAKDKDIPVCFKLKTKVMMSRK